VVFNVGGEKMKKVFITRRIPEVAINILRQSCSVYVNNKDRQLTKKEIIAGVKDMDAILSLLTDRIDREVMDASKNLKIIANYAVGYDNIDIEEATERGIVVTNTPGVLTETTADLAWALLVTLRIRFYFSSYSPDTRNLSPHREVRIRIDEEDSNYCEHLSWACHR